jgi:hypothetical protein
MSSPRTIDACDIDMSASRNKTNDRGDSTDTPCNPQEMADGLGVAPVDS